MSSHISLHVVLDNIPKKNYPNYHFKLPYQYRIKLEMSSSSSLLSPVLKDTVAAAVCFHTTICLFRFVPLFITTSVDNYTLRNETEQVPIM